MRKVSRLATVLAITALVAITLSAFLPTSTALTVSSASSKAFTVIVSRNGFNGTAKFSVTVQQGDLVKITFVYGDNDLAYDNPHEMTFEHYGIHTAKVGKSNPTATVEFVADTAGSFSFYCDIPCVGMENLLGHLIVASTETSPTAITLGLRVSAVDASSNSVLISAKMEDPNGHVVVGVPVRFYENTTFGELLLGSVVTNSQGVAILNYTSSRTGPVEITAESLGNAKSVGVTMPISTIQAPDGKIYLEVNTPSRPTDVYYGISYPSNLAMIGVPRLVNIVIVLIAGLVIVGVWGTYGYVWRQLANVPRAGSERLPEPAMPLPEVSFPLDSKEFTAEQTSGISGKTLFLLLLTPLLGAGDVMLVNNLGLPLMSTVIALVGLAVVEAVALVVVGFRNE